MKAEGFRKLYIVGNGSLSLFFIPTYITFPIIPLSFLIRQSLLCILSPQFGISDFTPLSHSDHRSLSSILDILKKELLSFFLL